MNETKAGLAAAIALLLYGVYQLKKGGTVQQGNASGGVNGNTLIVESQKYLNRPYYLGAGQHESFPDPPYIDCGLMTKKALAACGVNVQRTVTEQVKAAPFTVDVMGRNITDIQSLLKPGDLIAFDWSITTGDENDRYSHTGIWTGTRVRHASSSQGKVIDSPLSYFPANGFRTIYSWSR